MGSHYTVSTYTKDGTHSSSGQPIVAFHLLLNRFGGLCLSSVEAGAADAHLCVALPLENFTQKVLACCFVLFCLRDGHLCGFYIWKWRALEGSGS